MRQIKRNSGLMLVLHIKEINNDNLKPYYDELKGTIILSIDNMKTTDIETTSRILEKKTKTKVLVSR